MPNQVVPGHHAIRAGSKALQFCDGYRQIEMSDAQEVLIAQDSAHLQNPALLRGFEIQQQAA